MADLSAAFNCEISDKGFSVKVITRLTEFGSFQSDWMAISIEQLAIFPIENPIPGKSISVFKSSKARFNDDLYLTTSAIF
jgi:hypothetical protein